MTKKLIFTLSGGPLMCNTSEGKWQLFGITSNGDGCARVSRPGIYSSVIKFVGWIEKEMNKQRPLVPLDPQLIEKYSNKELLDELKLFNNPNSPTQQDFLNAEFVLSSKEKQELMEQSIRAYDKNSRTYTGNLRIASEFKNPTTSRISRRMAKLDVADRKVPQFVEQDEVINYCDGMRCPLGRCLNVSQVCNGVIECRNGEDELNC